MENQGLPARLVALIVLVCLGGLAWLAYLGLLHASWTPLELAGTAAITVLIGVAGVFPLPVGPRIKATVTTAPLFAGALLLPPGNAALAAVVGGLGYQFALRFVPQGLSLPWFKYPLNAGETSLSTGAASLLFHLLAEEGAGFVTPAVPLAAGTMYLVNTGLISIAAALHSGHNLPWLWWEGTKENGAAELSLYSFGLLGAVAVGQSPWLALAIFIPVGIIYVAFSRLAAVNAELEDTLARLKELQGRLVSQSKLSSVGSLSLDLSHQIKNPLFILTGRLESLQRRLPATDPGRASLDAALNAAWRIQQLLTSFLSAGRHEWASVKPADVVEEALGMTRIDHHKAVEIQRSYATDLPVLQGNFTLLREALSNLIANALDAAPEGSQVALCVSATQEAVMISIVDHGPGIPLEQMRRLFEPFNSSKQKGLGLGIFSAKHIVELHQGTLAVESAAGGTQITVRLPRTDWTGDADSGSLHPGR